jgi:hypothetical protein
VREALRRAVSEHLGLKLVSLAIAIALYFVVRADSVKELEVEIPVALTGLDQELVMTGEVPSSVRVRLQGRWSRLLRVLEKKPRPYELVVGDLRDGKSFTFEEARVLQLLEAEGLTVMAIEPQSVLAKLERKATRRVPVQVEIVGDPALGYEVLAGDVAVDPLEVTIVGARSSVEAISHVTAKPVQLGGVTRDFRTEVALRKPDRSHISLDPDRVTVAVTVRERQITDELVAVPVYVSNCGPQMRCTTLPSRVKVRARGPLRAIRELKDLGEEQMVVLDAGTRGMSPGRYDDLALEAKRFEGVVFELEPETVQLTVESLAPPAPTLEEPPPLPGPADLDADAMDEGGQTDVALPDPTDGGTEPNTQHSGIRTPPVP